MDIGAQIALSAGVAVVVSFLVAGYSLLFLASMGRADVLEKARDQTATIAAVAVLGGFAATIVGAIGALIWIW